MRERRWKHACLTKKIIARTLACRTKGARKHFLAASHHPPPALPPPPRSRTHPPAPTLLHTPTHTDTHRHTHTVTHFLHTHTHTHTHRRGHAQTRTRGHEQHAYNMRADARAHAEVRRRRRAARGDASKVCVRPGTNRSHREREHARATRSASLRVLARDALRPPRGSRAARRRVHRRRDRVDPGDPLLRWVECQEGLRQQVRAVHRQRRGRLEHSGLEEPREQLPVPHRRGRRGRRLRDVCGRARARVRVEQLLRRQDDGHGRDDIGSSKKGDAALAAASADAGAAGWSRCSGGRATPSAPDGRAQESESFSRRWRS